MSGAAESKDRSRTKPDRRPQGSDGIAEQSTEPALVERVTASELRTITPEEIQILAATGC